MMFAIGTPLHDIEMRVIRETLRHTRGDKRLAAKLLGIATRTIYRRLAEVGEGSPGEDEVSPEDAGHGDDGGDELDVVGARARDREDEV
jgi:two-component system response regulator HydG